MPLPVRAFAPFTPRPDVLPRPDEEPRPTFVLCLCAPGLLRISLSFILLAFFHDLDEVLDGADHAADRRRILKRARAANLAEAETAQRCFLFLRAARGASDLPHRHRLACFL